MARALMTPEAVQEIENHFFVGNFQDAVAEALEFQPEDDVSGLFRDFYLYRAYVAQRKYGNVLSEIKPSHHPALRAVRIFAEYMQNRTQRDKCEAAVSEVRALMTSASHPLVNVMAATIFNHEDNAADALRALHNEDSLEGMAISVQTYIRIARNDLAKQTVEAMKQIDQDDRVITQLAEAWVHCAVGGDKVQEAMYIFQGLAEQFAVTVRTLNGQAVCHMLRGKFSEAQDLLNEALERNNTDPESLANMYLCMLHSNASDEAANGILQRLRQADPCAHLVRQIDAKEALFDRSATRFAAAAH